MGTIIGLLILAGIDVYLRRKTGLHLHQWIAKNTMTLKKRISRSPLGMLRMLTITPFEVSLNSFTLMTHIILYNIFSCTYTTYALYPRPYWVRVYGEIAKISYYRVNSMSQNLRLSILNLYYVIS